MQVHFKIFHYYWIPLVCMVVWWGMLIAMLAAWGIQGRPIYSFMSSDDTLVYLSDVGATNLQPLFIACSGFQAIFFAGTLLMDFVLRRQHKLQGYVSKKQVPIAILSIFFAVCGQLGIIFVSIFNTNAFHTIHLSMVAVFIGCCFIAIFLNLTNTFLFGFFSQRLTPQHDSVFFGKSRFANIYMVSCFLKVFWLATASSFALAFAVFMEKLMDNKSATFEWIICFWYGLLLLMWSIDLFPAAVRHWKARHNVYTGRDFTKEEGEFASAHSDDAFDSLMEEVRRERVV